MSNCIQLGNSIMAFWSYDNVSCVGCILPQCFLIVVRIVGVLFCICQLSSMCWTVYWKSLSYVWPALNLIFQPCWTRLLKQKSSKLNQIWIEVMDFICKMIIKCNSLLVSFKEIMQIFIYLYFPNCYNIF